jgi:hypothetical protein
VNSGVTITIVVGPGGTATTHEVASSQQAGEGGPPPMALENLQSSSAQLAPVPMSPEELSGVQAAASTGAPPPPMAIEQLLMAGGASAAPLPQPYGSLEGIGGAPTPRPLEELGLTTAAVPQPMPLEQLGGGSPPPHSERPVGRGGRKES